MKGAWGNGGLASEAPPFWWEPPDWRGRALVPFAWVYGKAATRRLKRAPRTRVPAPVFCVGNFTVGGSGKTPVAIAIAEEARRAGRKPGFLSRGYGARFSGARLVDPGIDDARSVGDEPMLLAARAPVAVAPDRLAGARLLVDNGVDFIVMDDGFQSGRIHMDFSLLVVDGRRGLGNAMILPAGPLRAPVVEQLRLCDAVMVVNSNGGAEPAVRMAARAAKPVYRASFVTMPGHGITGRKVLAFAGIGDPDKFFRTVRQTGAEIVEHRTFPDHHPYSDANLAELEAEAIAKGLELVTTAKDAIRLNRGTAKAAAFLQRLKVLSIEAVFEETVLARRLVDETVARFRTRSLAERKQAL